ncbi:outer membrane beta-barrel family protein [Lacinutrix sp. MedPE-SW]|uniref:TonB-dependent receptor domain-containing protein n=1 Tax=Lacinutrix sp. MedPE-SW TaxID=1860087 RepID=UPI0009241C10|nr:outer membrane beta-barrel family protein [Lacinutrix sp. MedPE-SW]OIQ23449.1 MAG: hypothetical protein BM549_02470 [Lacinutrix sp. MedPE-SW]
MKGFFYIFFFFTTIATAQEFNITGNVVDENNEPIPYVNSIISTIDEVKIITGSTTNESGNFVIEAVKPDNYILKFSFIGYDSYSKKINVDKDLNVGTIVLKTSSESLDEITVNYKKPSVKVQPDRLIFDVQNTALTEGNLLDVLRNTPSVLVSGESISIKRSSPTIYINDKKVNLSGTEIIQLLESSPANSVKSIEAITTPGAKYDASSGTVLNIIMDKNLITGYRGRVFGGYKQGVFPSYNGGISNFFKNKSISLSANYSYSKNKINRFNDGEINYLDEENNLDELWDSKLNRNTWSEKHTANINLDYFINENNTFSLSSNISLTPYFKYRTQNLTRITDDSSNLLSSFNANTLSRDDKHNLGFDADYVSTFNNNSKLSINAHYTNYEYSREQNVNSQYYTSNGDFDYATGFNTDSNQDIDIVSAKADYYIPFNDDTSLSLGIKGSFVNTGSNITRIDALNNQTELNSANIFDYSENVFATYASLDKVIGDFSLTTSLRLEQTNLEGKSLGNIHTQDYLKLFPTIIVNHQTTESTVLYAKYKRSISRPSYQSLNPFQFFLNDNVIVSGNPNLQPSFINKWDVGTIINDRHQIYITLTSTEDNINELPIQNNETNIITYTPTNIGKTTALGFSYESYFTVFDKLSLYFGTEVYNTLEKTQILDQAIELDQWSNYTYLIGDISFLKDNSLSTSFSLTYSSKNLQGLLISKGQLFSDIAISKTIWNKKGTVSLIASDLFNKADYNTVTNYFNQRNSQFTNLDNRYIKLGFSYKFGNSTLSSNEKNSYNKERNRIQNRD